MKGRLFLLRSTASVGARHPSLRLRCFTTTSNQTTDAEIDTTFLNICAATFNLPKEQRASAQKWLLEAATARARAAEMEQDKAELRADKDHLIAGFRQEKEELEHDKDHQIERLVQDKRKAIERLLQDQAKLHEDITDLRTNRDHQIARLEKDQAELYEDNAVLEAECLFIPGQHTPVYSLRPLLWNFATIIYSMRGGGVEKLKKCLITPQNTLTPAAEQATLALGGRVDDDAAVDELVQLLSISFFHDPFVSTNGLIGFVCAAKSPPCRLAMGVALTIAQQEVLEVGRIRQANFLIQYCNDAGEVTHYIQGGKVMPAVRRVIIDW